MVVLLVAGLVRERKQQSSGFSFHVVRVPVMSLVMELVLRPPPRPSRPEQGNSWRSPDGRRRASSCEAGCRL